MLIYTGARQGGSSLTCRVRLSNDINKKGKSCDFADAIREDFQMDNRYFF
jgi:hypothetical protein